MKFQPITPYLACTAALLLAVPACSPKVDNGGYVNEDAIKNQITVGQSTRDQVKEKLGSPSSQSSFGDETWYYIADRKEGYAFLAPHVVQQDVTQIVFDKNGVVSQVQTYSLKDGEKISLVKRTTPTEGHTLGFFEQVLGNIGRFNQPTDTGGPPGSRRPGY